MVQDRVPESEEKRCAAEGSGEEDEMGASMRLQAVRAEGARGLPKAERMEATHKRRHMVSSLALLNDRVFSGRRPPALAYDLYAPFLVLIKHLIHCTHSLPRWR